MHAGASIVAAAPLPRRPGSPSGLSRRIPARGRAPPAPQWVTPVRRVGTHRPAEIGAGRVVR
jgi:hypothetical protein